MSDLMRHLERNQPFKKMTDEEQKLLFIHNGFKSTSVIRAGLNIGADYSLWVEIKDIPESGKLLSTEKSLNDYLDSIRDQLDVEYGELSQCRVDFLQFLTTSQHSKVHISKDAPLPIDLGEAKHIVDSKNTITTKIFIIGECKGLEFSIKTLKDQKVNVDNFAVNKSVFENQIWTLTESSWRSLQKEALFDNALSVMSKGKEHPHCILYSVLEFFKRKRRLPYNNDKDQQMIWSIICGKYPLHPTEKNAVKTPESIFYYSDIWKQYNRTYSDYILSYLIDEEDE